MQIKVVIDVSVNGCQPRPSLKNCILGWLKPMVPCLFKQLTCKNKVMTIAATLPGTYSNVIYYMIRIKIFDTYIYIFIITLNIFCKLDGSKILCVSLNIRLAHYNSKVKELVL